jgi:hypothetical protein
MKKLLLLSLLVLFGCSKGELPDSNYAGNFDLEVTYDLSVDTTRLNATVNTPSLTGQTYAHDPQTNNHPGYGNNPPGWLNLEYTKKNEWHKTYVLGVGMVERELLAGTEVTISATPALEMEFHEWSNGVTENPIIIKMNSDIDITAVFKSTSD